MTQLRAGVVLLAALQSGTANAQTPPAGWGTSVEILNPNQPLQTRPSGESARRGAAAAGVRLPVYTSRRGPGCEKDWLMVGPVAWVCEDEVRVTPQPAVPPRGAPRLLSDGLPYRYYFVGQYGTLGYAKLAEAEEGAPDAQLDPGFAVAVVRVADKVAGDPFGLTTRGIWLPLRDLTPAREQLFSGTELPEGRLDVGWVYTDSAPVHDRPGGTTIRGEVRTRFEAIHVLEQKTHHGRKWYRIGEARWLSDRHARVPTPASPPAQIRPGERWIDVDLENQIVTAYEGDRPVFATLTSTGKGREGSEQATPRGEFRIWVKLRSSDMDNLENEEANRYYAIQDVPWVMYFEKGYGLHGTFWHRSFGRIQSHGCVNLAPLDAQRLFYWTSPRLPAGWTAALPTPYEPGTLVRVR